MERAIDLLAEQPLLLLFVVAGLGYAIGEIKIKGTGLGVAAVLFVGLAFGALDERLTLPPALVSLGLDARDDRDANRQAQSQGYTVLAVRRAGRAALPSLRAARFPLVLFTQELLALLRSGISLVEALETLAEKDSRASSGPVLTSLLEKLREGQSFSSALQGAPEAFPDLCVATVRASERTGQGTDLVSVKTWPRPVTALTRPGTARSRARMPP